ncbi:hypothetical protein NON00_00665 [Roseomonas sp. GC11]|uniref:hypothetical protein n=1 Tax=Roseomonas sp. GC11 TaxID=2950546 RepID=UPI00210E2B95|nr:hypothetical protein [Roseomonas sp. GC11]MCQ4158439.1 hypothetical protein [Roseomonas sp. GC11]
MTQRHLTPLSATPGTAAQLPPQTPPSEAPQPWPDPPATPPPPEVPVREDPQPTPLPPSANRQFPGTRYGTAEPQDPPPETQR